MSSLTEEASRAYSSVRAANPGMTPNQALIAIGAAGMIDLNNELYDTGVSSSDVPAYNPKGYDSDGSAFTTGVTEAQSKAQQPDDSNSPGVQEITPLDFGKTLLNQVVGITENPNNLSSERVLGLVRQGFKKPGFMQEYLNSGGTPPQYSVLSDSEYMDAYRTDLLPDKRADPGLDYDSDPGPNLGIEDYDPGPDPEPDPDPGLGSEPTPIPFMPGDPNSPYYQDSLPPQVFPQPPFSMGDPNGPYYQDSLGPGRTDGLNPQPPMTPPMGRPAGPPMTPPPVASESLLSPSYQYAKGQPMPAPQPFNYSPYNYTQPAPINDVMKRLLQQQQQRPLV